MLCLGLFAACGPTPAPGPGGTISPYSDPNRFTYNDPANGWAAVDYAFSQWGPQVTYCAQLYAERESHHHAGSSNGTHFGLFQMDSGKAGSILAAAQTLSAPPSWYQPWVNAWAAMILWHVHGNFSPWWFPRIPGC